MSWYKESHTATEDYSITLRDGGTILGEYVFSNKSEAIDMAKKFKGKYISEHEWEFLNFVIISSGFTYKDVFESKFPFDDTRGTRNVRRNRGTVNDGYNSGYGVRDHFLGKKDYFSEE